MDDLKEKAGDGDYYSDDDPARWLAKRLAHHRPTYSNRLRAGSARTLVKEIVRAVGKRLVII